MRDLKELIIISTFVFEMQKNAMIISQQMLNNKRMKSEQQQRLDSLLRCANKFSVIIESPNMLNVLSPAVSTIEKYSFKDDVKDQKDESPDMEINPNEKHVRFTSTVMDRYFEKQSMDRLAVAKKKQYESPLPHGSLINKSVSNDENNINSNNISVKTKKNQFLQRMEFFLIEILKNIMFSVRFAILDNWKIKQCLILFNADLHFSPVMNNNNSCIPSISMLVELCNYCITHLKAFYMSSNERKMDYHGPLSYLTPILRNQNRKKYKNKKNDIYVSHTVTYENIEKFSNCFVSCFLRFCSFFV